MFQKIFFIVCFLFISASLFSQETGSVEKKSELPSSIYVKSYNSSISISKFNNDLKLKGFNFLIFDKENLINNYFAVDFRNIERKGSKFYYQSFRDADLYKHFPVVPDIMELIRFGNNNTLQSN